MNNYKNITIILINTIIIYYKNNESIIIQIKYYILLYLRLFYL